MESFCHSDELQGRTACDITVHIPQHFQFYVFQPLLCLVVGEGKFFRQNQRRIGAAGLLEVDDESIPVRDDVEGIYFLYAGFTGIDHLDLAACDSIMVIPSLLLQKLDGRVGLDPLFQLLVDLTDFSHGNRCFSKPAELRLLYGIGDLQRFFREQLPDHQDQAKLDGLTALHEMSV